nr:hypothetical protein [Amycolatopsis pretoriensis]
MPSTANAVASADPTSLLPSLAGLVPQIPEFVETPAPAPAPAPFEEGGSILRNEAVPPPVPAPKPAPKRVRPPRDEDEEPPSSWMTRGD